MSNYTAEERAAWTECVRDFGAAIAANPDLTSNPSQYAAWAVEFADAVLAASIFHYGEYTVQQAKARMRERGIPVRL